MIDRRQVVRLLGMATAASLVPGCSPGAGPIKLSPRADSAPPTSPPIDPSTPLTTTPLTTTASSSGQASTTTRTARARIEVICREAWGAAPSAPGFVEHSIVRLTLHHTAVVLADPVEAPARARRHQAFHQSKGWPDLAYHFLVDPAGYVYRGRPVEYRGDTATEYDPTGHLLVCAEGDFNRETPTKPQLAAVVGLFTWASASFGVDPATLAGHRDYAATSCPGETLYQELGELERRIRDGLAGGGVELVEICGDDADRLVAMIESGDRS